ncbi:zinc finger, CCHC-type containing protein, partial [Tanacetum coccineum]
MDLGGSYHMTYKRDYLFDFEEYDGGNILLGDGKECRGSTQQCMKSGVAKHLSVAGIQQHNELAEDTNMTFLAKVRYFLIQFGLSKVFWAKDTTMSIYLVNRSLSSAIGFKTLIDMLGFLGWLTCIKQGMLKIFMGCREGIVGNKLWRLHDVTLKVVLYRNMGFNKSGEYKKTFIDSGVGKAVMTVKAITGSIHQAEIWDIKGFLDEAKDNILGMEVVRDQSGNTLRVSQSRVYNGKSVQTLLEGHSILSLEVSLSGDCDVEKN